VSNFREWRRKINNEGISESIRACFETRERRLPTMAPRAPDARLFEMEMTMEQSKREACHTNKGRHFGQCGGNSDRRTARDLLEVLAHKASARIMIVQKFSEQKLPPKSGSSSKPWLELASVNVFAPIDSGNT
jgi:hypothetical protein